MIIKMVKEMSSRKTIKLVLANATLQNGNRGCVALTVSMLYIINKIFEGKIPKVEYYLPDAQIKSWDFNGICKIDGKEITVKSIGYDASDSFFSTIKRCIYKGVKYFLKFEFDKNYFKSADYILNIGQGDSFSDIYGEERFNHIDRANRIARYYNKPLCILPQTIGPFSDKEIEKKAAFSINNAKMVMVRDSKSRNLVRQIVPSVNVKEYLDVAFFLPYNIINQSKEKIHVGLNVSALLWNKGYNRNNQFGIICDYQHLIRSIVNCFLEMPDVLIHLIPHVVEPDPGVENDYEVSYNLWKEFDREQIRIAPFALSPIEIKSYIAGMDFVMGARMHATIAAFSSGVPVVPMAYSQKFNGLYEDTLNYYHLVDLKSQDEEEILTFVKNSFFNRYDLKSEIDIQNSTIVKEYGIMLENDLKRFFGLC